MVKLLETGKMVVAKRGGNKEMGSCHSTGIKIQLYKEK